MTDSPAPRRVQIPPHTDAWMRGDRYGTLIKTGTKYDHVLMDRSGRTLRILKGTCTPVPD